MYMNFPNISSSCFNDSMHSSLHGLHKFVEYLQVQTESADLSAVIQNENLQIAAVCFFTFFEEKNKQT